MIYLIVKAESVVRMVSLLIVKLNRTVPGSSHDPDLVMIRSEIKPPGARIGFIAISFKTK